MKPMGQFEVILLEDLDRLPPGFASDNQDILQEIAYLQNEIEEAYEWIKGETRTCIVGSENRARHYKTIKYCDQDIEWQLGVLNERRKECINWD